MRSPNKRSRSKSNRPKTLGNIVNRVFDSSGPEGKVRGTPQQIIEKYQLLARDAQLSNDRVAAENFQQHAEHYTRLLAQAQREMQAEQEARRQQHEERTRQASEERNNQDRGQQNGQQNHSRRDVHRSSSDADTQRTAQMRDAGSHGAFAVQDDHARPDQDSLVETPESKSTLPAEQPDAPVKSTQPKQAADQSQPEQQSQPVKSTRKPRTPRASASKSVAAPHTEESDATVSVSEPQPEAGAVSAGEGAQTIAKPRRRYVRKTRQTADSDQNAAPQSAAE